MTRTLQRNRRQRQRRHGSCPPAPARVASCRTRARVFSLPFPGLSSIALSPVCSPGKTLQVIAFLSYLKYERGIAGPHLIVVPLSVMSAWMSEFKRWSPGIRVVRYHGPLAERRRLQNDDACFGNFDVCVTSYETVSADEDFFRYKWIWQYVVVDEGHRIVSAGQAHAMRVRKALVHALTSSVPPLCSLPLTEKREDAAGPGAGCHSALQRDPALRNADTGTLGATQHHISVRGCKQLTQDCSWLVSLALWAVRSRRTTHTKSTRCCTSCSRACLPRRSNLIDASICPPTASIRSRYGHESRAVIVHCRDQGAEH